jgi:hypothetical protein
LGRGGRGAVFLAEQIAVGNRPVALYRVLNRDGFGEKGVRGKKVSGTCEKLNLDPLFSV